MRLIFTLLLAAFAQMSIGQNLTINHDTFQLELGAYIDLGVIWVDNHRTEAMEMAISLEPMCTQADDATKIQICYGELCWTPTDTATTWGMSGSPVLVIPAGGSASTFKFTPFFSSDYGSQWKVRFFDRNNDEDFVDLVVNIDACTTSSSRFLDNVNLQITNAYPVPARDHLTVECESRFRQAELRVTNAFGQLMSVTPVQGTERVHLDVSDLVPGTYFYALYAEGVQCTPSSFVITD